MNNDLVSIITPSYKSEKFISEAIRSVINQTHKNLEMIIVDDLSPDDANKIIEDFSQSDARVKLLKLDHNMGPAVARNTAIQAASGRYIAFLDADDMWVPEKLEKQLSFMNEKGCALCYSAYDIINADGKPIKCAVVPPKKLSYRQLLFSNSIGCLTAIYDASKIGKVYMPTIRKRQDYGLWLRILKKCDYAYGLQDVLAHYRIVPESVSSNKLKLMKYNYILFREHEGFSALNATFFLIMNIINKLIKR